MTDRDWGILLHVAGLCLIGAFWPLIKSWLGRRGLQYRSMSEQREYEAQQEREKQK